MVGILLIIGGGAFNQVLEDAGISKAISSASTHLSLNAGSWHASLVVVAIGARSVGLNYVNHAGFWLVKESFGMPMGQALKVSTTVQTLVSVFGLAMVMLLSLFL